MKLSRIGMMGLFLIWVGCSIKAPEVRVTGEKTALEQEVIGTYHQMEEDIWMIASTRAADGESSIKLSPEKRKVLEAMQDQRFNKDDIDEFKKNGYVGEDNRGFLAVRPSSNLETDEEMMKLVSDIVGEENEDRRIIMDRVVELSDDLKKANENEVLRVFAQMNYENSPKGSWVQEQDGTWIKK
jgi:uncharacterized protein YdbL (DUF1318 family)